MNRSGIFSTYCLFACFALASCGLRLPTDDNVNAGSADSQPNISPPLGIHLLLGNPSNAKTDAQMPDDYLIVGDAFAISYNNSRGTLNWSSWKTTREDLGDRLERAEFHPDSRLPTGFTRITTFDYIGSGYDRGHICPSADRFGRPDANFETFAMTNIVPQTGSLNQFPWQKLESYSRAQVRRGNDVYTIAGVFGAKGRIRNKITVPESCWKILVIVRRGTPLERIDRNSKVVAVEIPNISGLENADWRNFQTSVRALEQKTGYDFLSALPVDVQDRLENYPGK